MLANKYISVALGLATVIVGYLATVDWATLAPSYAGSAVMAIGLLKAILGAVQPPASQATITSTGGSIITHT